PGGVQLSATSADGRHTTRLLTRVTALTPTALGIVASLPPDSNPASQTPTPDEKLAPRNESAIVDGAPSKQSTDPTPQIWLGAATGVRIAAPTLLGMLDIEGRMGFEAGRWLVVASFRYGTSLGESGVSTDDSYYELVGALGVGRRFSVGSSVLDVVILPALARASLDYNDDDDGPSAGPRTEARVGTSFCWWTAFGDGSRINLTADTDVAPYGFFRGVRTAVSEPPMPVWTIGLRLGASGRIL
ncbi:MAG: hypothetical protein ABI183_15100, partial [Polyangiaceae bacterium]